MGFFSNLFRRNPTADWIESVGTITVDIGQGMVMGRGLRAAIDDFRTLGPATEWPGKIGSGTLKYPAKGIELDFEYAQFVGATVWLNKSPSHPDDPALHPFSGKFSRGGIPLKLATGDSEQHLFDLFGKPATRDEDEDETILQYRFADVYVEFEIPVAHGLSVINFWHEGAVVEPKK